MPRQIVQVMPQHHGALPFAANLAPRTHNSNSFGTQSVTIGNMETMAQAWTCVQCQHVWLKGKPFRTSNKKAITPFLWVPQNCPAQFARAKRVAGHVAGDGLAEHGGIGIRQWLALWAAASISRLPRHKPFARDAA